MASQRNRRWLQFELGYGFGQPRKSPLLQRHVVSVEVEPGTSRTTDRRDQRDDRESPVPQQTRNTAVEGSGVRKNAECARAGSTEAVQRERKRRERRRRVNDEPLTSLPRQTEGRPTPLPTHKRDGQWSVQVAPDIEDTTIPTIVWDDHI